MKAHFSRFLGAQPDRLHVAAHSHHPWPDVSFDAHQQAWNDAAELMDDKWGHIFESVIPPLTDRLASLLGLHRTDTITFAPSTHEFLVRIFSTFDTPVEVLTTDSEFHSFTRQSRRWEEAGLAGITRIPTQPFDSFSERFAEAARDPKYRLIYLSEVFYDSGFVVSELDRVVSAVSNPETLVVVDGYHAFMARPTGSGPIQDRAFYLAGGYKYAMSGEGVCFLHSPPGYGARPTNTGWYAGFGQLESGVSDTIAYATDGSRFAGATFDPSGLYRMSAVLSWLAAEGIGPAQISQHVTGLQDRFLAAGKLPGELLPPNGHQRGNFMTFRTGHAGDIYRDLHSRGVITDYRGDRLRIGFGIYHNEDDVDRLLSELSKVV